jgi:hypothetical protein
MRTLLAITLLATISCSRSPAPPTPPSSLAPPPEPALSLVERLTREAGTRPAARVPAERVHAGLGAIERWKQVLASPIQARFCMAGQTAGGVGVAVCEYEDAAAAARGLSYSRATFDRLIPGRQLSLNGQTLLTLTAPPELAGETHRLAAAFAAL